MFTRKEILGAIVFFAMMFVFSAVVIPTALDREAQRMETVQKYNVSKGWVK